MSESVASTTDARERKEFLGLVVAAVRVVVPGFTGLPTGPAPVDEQLEFRSGNDLWEWATSTGPVGSAMAAVLSTEQQDVVRRVLDGMLRERALSGL